MSRTVTQTKSRLAGLIQNTLRVFNIGRASIPSITTFVTREVLKLAKDFGVDPFEITQNNIDNFVKLIEGQVGTALKLTGSGVKRVIDTLRLQDQLSSFEDAFGSFEGGAGEEKEEIFQREEKDPFDEELVAMEIDVEGDAEEVPLEEDTGIDLTEEPNLPDFPEVPTGPVPALPAPPAPPSAPPLDPTNIPVPPDVVEQAIQRQQLREQQLVEKRTTDARDAVLLNITRILGNHYGNLTNGLRDIFLGAYDQLILGRIPFGQLRESITNLIRQGTNQSVALIRRIFGDAVQDLATTLTDALDLFIPVLSTGQQIVFAGIRYGLQGIANDTDEALRNIASLTGTIFSASFNAFQEGNVTSVLGDVRNTLEGLTDVVQSVTTAARSALGTAGQVGTAAVDAVRRPIFGAIGDISEGVENVANSFIGAGSLLTDFTQQPSRPRLRGTAPTDSVELPVPPGPPAGGFSTNGVAMDSGRVVPRFGGAPPPGPPGGPPSGPPGGPRGPPGGGPPGGGPPGPPGGPPDGIGDLGGTPNLRGAAPGGPPGDPPGGDPFGTTGTPSGPGLRGAFRVKEEDVPPSGPEGFQSFNRGPGDVTAGMNRIQLIQELIKTLRERGVQATQEQIQQWQFMNLEDLRNLVRQAFSERASGVSPALIGPGQALTGAVVGIGGPDALLARALNNSLVTDANRLGENLSMFRGRRLAEKRRRFLPPTEPSFGVSYTGSILHPPCSQLSLFEA